MLKGMSQVQIAKLVDHTYKESLKQMKEKALLKKSVDEVDPATIFPDKNSAKFKAMQHYQDMLGLEEGWDVSDETWDKIKNELILNVALIAVSGFAGTGVRWLLTSGTEALAGGAWGARVARGATALMEFGARGFEVGNIGKITIGGVGLAMGEGAVFHEVESGLVHGDWFKMDKDKVRGMLMSGLMFNLFRGGNAVYENTWGRALEGRFGTQMQVKDVFRSAAEREAINGGAISRGRTLWNSIRHKLVRTTGETIPFFGINGAVANLTTDENYFTWENLGKDWMTLFLLAQLPKIGKRNKPGPEGPKPKDFKLPEYLQIDHATSVKGKQQLVTYRVKNVTDKNIILEEIFDSDFIKNGKGNHISNPTKRLIRHFHPKKFLEFVSEGRIRGFNDAKFTPQEIGSEKFYFMEHEPVILHKLTKTDVLPAEHASSPTSSADLSTSKKN